MLSNILMILYLYLINICFFIACNLLCIDTISTCSDVNLKLSIFFSKDTFLQLNLVTGHLIKSNCDKTIKKKKMHNEVVFQIC